MHYERCVCTCKKLSGGVTDWVQRCDGAVSSTSATHARCGLNKRSTACYTFIIRLNFTPLRCTPMHAC